MRPGAVALAATLVLAALHARWHAGFTVDDAAISFSYARSLADGVGLGILEPGGPRVEGYSNFLWVLVLALARAMGLPILATSKIVGAASLAGSCWLLHSILNLLVRRPALLWAGLLLPLSTCVVLWSMSGLESGFYLLLVLASCRLLLREERSPAWWNVGSTLALLAACLSRPDAFVFVVAAFASKIAGAALARGERGRRAGQIAVWTATLVLLYGVYLSWHVRFFGFVFPNPVYVKAGTPSIPDLIRLLVDIGSPGWRYVGDWLLARGGLVLIPTAVAGTIATFAGRNRVVPAFGAVALLLPLYRRDWMIEHRFLVPFVPFALALSAAGLDALLDLADRLRGRERIRIALGASAVALAALYAAVNGRASIERRASQYSLAFTMDEVRSLYGTMFTAPVKELGLSHPLVAIPDIGATTFDLRMNVVDVGGLVDANLAHARSVSEIEVYLFEERRPDLAHVHGQWMLPARLRGFRRDYEILSEGATHVEAVRRDLVADRAPATAIAPLAGPIGVAGFEGPEAAEPGGTLLFDLFLTSSENAPPPADLLFRVTRDDPHGFFEQPLRCGPAFFPPARWRSGERVRQRVAIPAGDRPGRLTVELLARRPETGAFTVGATRTVVIDTAAAAEYGRTRLTAAGALCDEGLATQMHRVIDVAQAAAPGMACWDRERAACNARAARGIAGQAREHFSRGRWKGALEILREADRVGAARRSSAELQELAANFLTLADAERDPTRRYLLYRASWFADPVKAAALRGLIEARHALFSPPPAQR